MQIQVKSYIIIINLIILLCTLKTRAAIGPIQINPEKIIEKKIIVAVLDTGIDLKNVKLTSKLWKNPGEIGIDNQGNRKENNGIDDDQNGFIDDVNGWNFLQNNADIQDHHGHGTHVSGIISGFATIPNQVKEYKENNNVELMILKYYDEGSHSTKTSLNSISSLINYAVKMNADIINFSGGGYGFDESEYQAIQLAEKKNVLLVSAAGNDNVDLNKNKYYPASYQLRNILSVGALNKFGEKLKASNFGNNMISAFAPGENIVSLWPGGRMHSLSGTSQATAFVTYMTLQLFQKHNITKKRPEEKYSDTLDVHIQDLESNLTDKLKELRGN